MDNKPSRNLTIPLTISLSLNIVALSTIGILERPRIETLLGIKKPVNSESVTSVKPNIIKTQADTSLFEETNPSEGYQIQAKFGNLGPKMIASGVIDLEKFKSVYESGGTPLSEEEMRILTQGSDSQVKIDSNNSHFLLNFFWAVGLANQTRILTEGDIVKYSGKSGAGNFASTGGWTLSKTSAMDYFSKSKLITLTTEQENLVNEIASNIYRPCCNNSTAFPDCNHGMALLGVIELMASSGASKDEIYQAAKYFNAFWFPGNYYDLATYFKNKEGKSFKDMDPQVILSKQYSSASGYQQVKRWLVENKFVSEPPKSGGGCGV